MLTGVWIAVMDHERHDRALQLTSHRTRCIQEKEIHEFIICDQATDISLLIDHLAYLGFGEFLSGGVIEIGDSLYIETRLIGKVVGFDETHFPNHYNIIVQGNNCISGATQNLILNSIFLIKKS